MSLLTVGLLLAAAGYLLKVAMRVERRWERDRHREPDPIVEILDADFFVIHLPDRTELCPGDFAAAIRRVESMERP